ncbi:lysis system i-spanin subunit Rz, partial [Burkholderia pseudomallei]
MCGRSGIAKWVIVSLGVQADGSIGIDDWCEFEPGGYVARLVGRQFVHGVHDCYAIVRDWYLAERRAIAANDAAASAVAAVDQRTTKERNEHEAENHSLRAALAAGTERLRVAVRRCTAAGRDGMPG